MYICLNTYIYIYTYVYYVFVCVNVHVYVYLSGGNLARCRCKCHQNFPAKRQYSTSFSKKIGDPKWGTADSSTSLRDLSELWRIAR